jgi:hypothetical protein
MKTGQEPKTVLNMAKVASSVRAHWFEYTGRADPIDCGRLGLVVRFLIDKLSGQTNGLLIRVS